MRNSQPGKQDAPGLLASDPAQASRVSHMGRLLRSTDLDEVPQRLNVARGEMTILGPLRARDHQNISDVHTLWKDTSYTDIWLEANRTIKPAILTLAGLDPSRKDVSGLNVLLDLWEVQNTSLLIDLFKIQLFIQSHLGLKNLAHLHSLPEGITPPREIATRLESLGRPQK